MTKKMKIFTWASVGTLSTGVVVGASVSIYLYLKNRGIDLGPAQYYKGKDKGEALFNFKWYKNSQGSEFLSEDGYKELDKYLTKYLYYGPESTALKEIVFGNRNVMDKETSGVYFGATRQIFINIENYIDTKNLTDDQKIQSISEVIAHEYGHHFAHIYLKNYKENIKNTEVVYDGDGNKTIWIKKYLDDWKEMNGFNNTERNKKINNKQLGQNINSTASLSDLYTMANSRDHKSILSDQKYYWGNELTPKDESVATFGNLSNLNYLYSADEQFVRLTEMLMWPKNYFLANGSFNNGVSLFVPEGNITHGNFLWSPQSLDLAHSTQLGELTSTKQPSLIYPNYPFGGDLFDKSQNPTKIPDYSEEYYNFLVSTMGYQSQLSHIYTKNSGEIVKSKITGKLNIKNDNLNDLNEIKLSGYTDDQWNYLAIVDNDNKKIVENIPITSNKYSENKTSALFHYFGRDTINQQFGKDDDIYSLWRKPPGSEKYAYIMKDFINAQKFEGNNYSLYFDNKFNIQYSDINTTPTSFQILNNINNYDGTNQLTTYEEYFPKNSLYWRLSFSGQKLVISKDY